MIKKNVNGNIAVTVGLKQDVAKVLVGLRKTRQNIKSIINSAHAVAVKCFSSVVAIVANLTRVENVKSGTSLHAFGAMTTKNAIKAIQTLRRERVGWRVENAFKTAFCSF